MNKEKYVIWYEKLDENGLPNAIGLHPKKYRRFGFAEFIAKRKYGDPKKFNYYVCSEHTSASDILNMMKGSKS